MRAVRIAWALLAVVLLASCGETDRRVRAGDYDSFWLWAGVAPQPALDRAKTVYLLGYELQADGGELTDLRPEPPRLPGRELWLVVRLETLRWPEDAADRLIERLGQWRSAGNRVAGLQVDFDARTRHLEEYGEFLKTLRRRLPPDYRLSVTGLLDWSANGDPRALASLKGTVDEVVVQTYQGRHTVPGYQAYFARMKGFPVPFKVGLVQNGEWTPPAGLERHPRFKGYVVFLLNPAKRR